ncbi:MAG: cytochrome P450 [Gammaproteobacteria bacterium]
MADATTRDDIADWVVDFMTDPTIDDPYPMMARLRAREPVHRSRIGPWLFTRYEDVDQVPRDPRWSRFQAASTELGYAPDLAEELAAALRASLMMLINRDEPDHRRIRQILQHAFTPRAIEGWRRTVEGVVAAVVDAVADEDEFDFLRRVGYPVPEKVICELMGVPHADHALWGAWAAKSVARNRVGAGDERNLRDAQDATLNFYRYFQDLVRERRKRPGQDLISVLIAAEEAGDRLDEDELIGTAIMLITAGHETTANMTGNGIYLLFRHPDQRALLQADAALVPGAVEEMLRFEPTTRLGLPRVAAEDIEIRGTVIPAGSRAVVVRPAANRDPAVFPDPDRFDVTRRDNRHLSFGTGVHFCLGAQLARMEMQSTFSAVIGRMPDLELAETPTWRASGVRSLNGLRVRRRR